MAFLDYDGLSHFKDKLDVEAEGKANVDGYYEELTAGSAEQLISTTYVEDNAPYTFRQSANGMDIGDRESDMLVGGTIAWNQLIKDGNFTSSNNWSGRQSTISVSNNIVTVTPSTDGTVRGLMGASSQIFNIIGGHKYILSVDVLLPITSNVGLSFSGIGTQNGSAVAVANTWTKCSKLWTKAEGLSGAPYALVSESLTTSQTAQFKNFIACDLTQMFGSTIADYIYGLETATPGAGVAWFKKYFPKDYYAYNTGTLMSVNAYSHETTGFNQWDEQWELGTYNATTGAKESGNANIRSKNYIPVTPGTVYYDNAAQHWIFYYDADKNFISKNVAINNLFTTPANAHYITFYMNAVYGTTYNHDICINFHRDGSRDGEYEAYDRHSYNLDSELQLRGIPKLDTSNNIYYDGDTYKSGGAVTRKYGIVDLGTLTTWTYTGGIFESLNLSNGKTRGEAFVCAKYLNSGSKTSANMDDKTAQILTDRIWIKDSAYSDAATFKTAMSGVYLVYELATPTEETATGFTNPQIVSGWGTEEYIDAGVYGSTRDVSIPVGHESQYLADLRGKLQHLPNLAPANGLYGIRQTGTQMELEEVGSTIDHKADIDGNYEDMTVGNAEQLVATVGIEDEVPYNFRTSGGSLDIGDRETDEIVGGTIAWNQLMQNGNFASDTGWSGANSSISVSDNVATITAAASGSEAYREHLFTTVANHKYLAIGECKCDGANWIVRVYYNGTSNNISSSYFTSSWNRYALVFSTSANSSGNRFRIYTPTASSSEKAYARNAVVFDLTQMFGSAIADYIYSLETSNAGAGVAWFKNLFPKDYYAYNAGTLMSVNTSAHKMTGFNQWDEQWELGGINSTTGNNETNNNVIRTKNYIQIIPGMTYYLKSPEYTYTYMQCRLYDENKTFIDSAQYTLNHTVAITNSRARYLRWQFSQGYGTSYKNDTCFNLSWDGSRDGEYEPYVEYNYPLDSSLELRGIPKLDSGNKLYYDGDTYESDGTVTRRYSVIDLGTLSWSYNSTKNCFMSTILNCVPSNFNRDSNSNNFICEVYTVQSWSSIDYGTASDMTAHFLWTTGVNTSVWIYDSRYTDATAFKTAVTGVHVVYEASTSTTETAEPYQNPQVVNDFGTEEYVDYAYEQNTRDAAIPVGHSTFYAANLKAKLEMLPNSPDGDGDYIVRQTNGENEFVQLVIPNELPDAPTTDGTYTLKATVADGTATLSWVSAT